MVHTEEINEPTTLCLPTEEDWSQSIVELYYIRYIESPEETPFENKKNRNKRCGKPFQKRFLDLVSGLIFYYGNLHTSRVRKLRLIAAPLKFI